MNARIPAAGVSRLRECYGRHPHAFHLVLLLLCGFAAYGNSIRVPYYFDDFPCIVQNPVVRQFSLLFELDRYGALGLDEDIRNNLVTRAVSYASFALNYRLHGYAVEGFHLVNLAIHLANALLVYALTLVSHAQVRPGRLPGCGCGKGVALAAALIFLLHPIQTNAVTYIVQRFASLATLFCLLALLSYARAALAVEARWRRGYYGAALLAALLAMFSKEIAFVLPVLIALYDFAFLPGERRQRLRRLTPLAAIMLLLPLTIVKLAAISEVTGSEVGRSLELMNLGRVSRWDYFFTQWRVLVSYLRLLIYPAGLNLDHDFPLYHSPVEAPVFFSGLLLAALFALGCFLLRRPAAGGSRAPEWRLVGFGMVWFFVTLAMESSIIPLDDLLQEYRLYLPSIGPILAVTTAADLLRRRVQGRAPRFARGLPVMAVVFVAALGSATVVRNRLWQDEVHFWGDAVEKSPGKARPHINLGSAYLARKRTAAALQQALAAADGSGHTFVTRYQLARLFYLLGEDGAAIVEMRRAIQLSPNRALFHGALGQLYLNVGDLPAAVNALRRALELDPGHAEARATLEALGALNAPVAVPPLPSGSGDDAD